MQEEEQAILRDHAFQQVQISKRLGPTYRKLEIGDKTVWLARCGIGAVNAGLTVGLLLEKYPLDGVVLLGVGGALVETLDVGDLVIANAVLQHDSVASHDAGFTDMRPGSLYLTSKDVLPPPLMPTDSALTQMLQGCVKSVGSEKVRVGTVVSGAEFAGTVERKQALADRAPDAILVDMEACGLAQVAIDAGLAFAVAKTVADRLRPETSIGKDFVHTLQTAAKYAGDLAQGLIERI